MKSIKLLFALTLGLTSLAQTGGEDVYPFLNSSFDARNAALGGRFITVVDQDLGLAVMNPALLNSKMKGGIHLDQGFLRSGINIGQLAYAHEFNKAGLFDVHFRYANYGKFDGADEAGNPTGSFRAGDMVLGVGYARPFGKGFNVGANLNMIFSNYESYNSMGTTLDLGVDYHLEDLGLNFTVLARNVGFQWYGFTSKNRESLPADIMAGISYRVHHAPFRVSIIGHDLLRWNLAYDDPEAKPTVDPLTGDTTEVERAGFGENLVRHMDFALEVLITENIHIRAAFNYQRRQELKIADRAGMAGFSFGAGFKVAHFRIDYGMAVYSVVGSTHSFGLSTSIGEWSEAASKKREKRTGGTELPSPGE